MELKAHGAGADAAAESTSCHPPDWAGPPWFSQDGRFESVGSKQESSNQTDRAG